MRNRKSPKQWRNIPDIFHYNLLPESIIEKHMPNRSMSWQEGKTQHDRFFDDYFRFICFKTELDGSSNLTAIKRAWISQNKNISKKKIVVPGFLQVKQKDVNALHYLIQAIREPERVAESLTALNNSLFDAYNKTKQHLTEEECKDHMKLQEDLYYITWFLWQLCRKP